MATATYIQKGENIDYTSASAVGYMDVVPLTTRIGVALEPIVAGGTGSLSITGVYELPAAVPLEIAVGEAVYWNTTNNNIDKTAAMVPAGVAVSGKISAGTTVRVKINP